MQGGVRGLGADFEFLERNVGLWLEVISAEVDGGRSRSRRRCRADCSELMVAGAREESSSSSRSSGLQRDGVIEKQLM